MKIKSLKVFIIKNISDEYIKKTIKSLISTTPQSLDLKYFIFDELNQREETLNHILKSVDNESDIFIVADDVVFTNGWFESLEKNYEKGDIISFSTLFPDSNIIQDYGYDFIKIDGDLSYRGLHKNKKLDEVLIDGPRKCDAVCGCIMFLKSNVIKNNHFPLDGNNRVGEMIEIKAQIKF